MAFALVACKAAPLPERVTTFNFGRGGNGSFFFHVPLGLPVDARPLSLAIVYRVKRQPVQRCLVPPALPGHFSQSPAQQFFECLVERVF